VSGNVTGLFYGDHSLHQLYAQLIAAVTCIAWNVVVGGGVFLLIERYIGSNRVPPQVEIAGLDIPEMGTPGYPEFITQMSREQVSLSDVDEARA
jgi:Amt family ammonium transporter